MNHKNKQPLTSIEALKLAIRVVQSQPIVEYQKIGKNFWSMKVNDDNNRYIYQYFIRLSTASDIARRVKYLHEPLTLAAGHAVEDLCREGGIGGVIALDDLGNGESLM